MTTMTINHISMLSNIGQAKQQDLTFALTGEIRKQIGRASCRERV